MSTDLECVILAGGLATRLGSLTREVPKSLLPVAGRPFLAHQLELLARSGFRRVLLLTGHLAPRIRAFAGDGSEFGLSIAYSDDGPEPLGTAGALRRALPLLAREFLVTYGDSYLPFDYSAPLRDLLEHPAALGTMAVFENRGRWDGSNTALEGELVRRYEKGSQDSSLCYIDYGAIALRRSVIEALPEGALGLDRVQAELAGRSQLRAYVARERFYEIGSPAGLAELDAYLSRQAPSARC